MVERYGPESFSDWSIMALLPWTRFWIPRQGSMSLGDDGSRALGQYSTGMQRRLALAGAMLADPKVLLLDEPTSGLDPEGSLLVMELLQDHIQRGGAILFSLLRRPHRSLLQAR